MREDPLLDPYRFFAAPDRTTHRLICQACRGPVSLRVTAAFVHFTPDPDSVDEYPSGREEEVDYPSPSPVVTPQEASFRLRSYWDHPAEGICLGPLRERLPSYSQDEGEVNRAHLSFFSAPPVRALGTYLPLTLPFRLATVSPSPSDVPRTKRPFFLRPVPRSTHGATRGLVASPAPSVGPKVATYGDHLQNPLWSTTSWGGPTRNCPLST